MHKEVKYLDSGNRIYGCSFIIQQWAKWFEMFWYELFCGTDTTWPNQSQLLYAPVAVDRILLVSVLTRFPLLSSVCYFKGEEMNGQCDLTCESIIIFEHSGLGCSGWPQGRIEGNWKRDKFLEIARNLKKIWNMKKTVIPIVIGVLGRVPKGSVQRLEDFEIWGWVKTIQTTSLLRAARILRKILEI